MAKIYAVQTVCKNCDDTIRIFFSRKSAFEFLLRFKLSFPERLCVLKEFPLADIKIKGCALGHALTSLL